MTHVIEVMNRELMMENYELKKQLRIAEAKMSEQAKNPTEVDKVLLELREVTEQYHNGQKKIWSLEQTILNLTITCNNVHAENMFMKEQLKTQSAASIERAYRVQQMQAVVKDLKAQQEAMEIHKQEAVKEEQVKEESVMDNKRCTLAMKLKLSPNGASNESPPKMGQKKRWASTSNVCLEVFKERTERRSTQISDELSHEMNGPVSARRMMISNLSPNTTGDDLKNYFSKFGTVLNAFVPNGTKGYGYIVLPYKDTGQFYLNRKHFIDGRQVTVRNYDKSYTPDTTNTLLISADAKVMAKLSADDLKDFFSQFGKVAKVRKPTDPVTKKPLHYGFVVFMSTDAAEDATENAAYIIKGQTVCVTKSKNQSY